MTINKIPTLTPKWSDVKARLVNLNHADILKLVQDMYASSKDNKVFLHTRLNLGVEPMELYKTIISQWINPPNYRFSVSKAKKAISDYKKAQGRPEVMAELTVFYCEEVFNFFNICGIEDEGYFNSLILVFEQAMKYVLTLPKVQQGDFLDRLEDVRQLGQNYGYGVGDSFNDIWTDAGLEIDE